MGYRVIEVFTAFVHFGFILYVVFGGFVAWKWRHTIVFHIAAAVWGIGSVLIGYDCPLTDIENWARRMAGITELPSTGFIAHYITGVFYPASAEFVVQCVTVMVVLSSWIGYLLLGRHARRSPGVPLRP